MFRERLFHYRGYTPIPFLVIMLLFARPVAWTMSVGLVVALLGEFLRFWGVAYAGSLTRVTGSVGAPEVIVAGPFAHVRNPLYLGNILLYAGIGVMSNAFFPWLVLVALMYFVFQYSQIVILEEQYLLKTFTASYEDFAENVPRFLPRVSPYRHDAQEHQTADWSGALRSERRTLQAFGLVVLVLIALWYFR
jgi:protein-S-isoprenylcysteine O-methyltransferase Ste14